MKLATEKPDEVKSVIGVFDAILGGESALVAYLSGKAANAAANKAEEDARRAEEEDHERRIVRQNRLGLYGYLLKVVMGSDEGTKTTWHLDAGASTDRLGLYVMDAALAFMVQKGRLQADPWRGQVMTVRLRGVGSASIKASSR